MRIGGSAQFKPGSFRVIGVKEGLVIFCNVLVAPGEEVTPGLSVLEPREH